MIEEILTLFLDGGVAFFTVLAAYTLRHLSSARGLVQTPSFVEILREIDNEFAIIRRGIYWRDVVQDSRPLHRIVLANHDFFHLTRRTHWAHFCTSSLSQILSTVYHWRANSSFDAILCTKL
jgi:hypothetical protein